jgi:hypothetical protein
MKKYESFALWAAVQRPKHKSVITALRKLVKRTAPALTEEVKWGNGCWIGKEWPVIFLHAEADHLQFGFFAGAELKDPDGLLEGKGKYVRHTKLRAAADIDEAALARLIRQAAKAERLG